MKELVEELTRLRNHEALIKHERLLVEEKIYNEAMKTKEIEDKSISILGETFKLTIKPNYSVKLDQVQARCYPEIFNAKYEMTYSQYKKAPNKSLINKVATITVNKPTFLVEEVQNGISN